MASFAKILAATDFSDYSLEAVRRAAGLVREGRANSGLLVHVMEPGLVDGLKRMLGRSPDIVSGLSQRLDQLAEDIAHDLGVSFETKLLHGPVNHSLGNSMGMDDLLVLGARGSHRSREWLLGTTAQRLVYRSPGAALVVRRPAASSWRRVMVATDFSEPSRRALAQAQRLASASEVELVHVYASPFEPSMHYAGVGESLIQEYRHRAYQEAEQHMQEWLDGTGDPGINTRLEAGYAPHRLQDLVVEREVDLLVVGKQGQSMARDTLVGSVTMSLLQRADCDVLVVG